MIEVWNGADFRSLSLPCLETWILLLKLEMLCSSNCSHESLFCLNSYQGQVMPSFSPTFNQAYVKLIVGMKKHTLLFFSYVAKLKAGSEKK
jgi:hypothetical protein